MAHRAPVLKAISGIIDYDGTPMHEVPGTDPVSLHDFPLLEFLDIRATAGLSLETLDAVTYMHNLRILRVNSCYPLNKRDTSEPIAHCVEPFEWDLPFLDVLALPSGSRCFTISKLIAPNLQHIQLAVNSLLEDWQPFTRFHFPKLLTLQLGTSLPYLEVEGFILSHKTLQTIAVAGSNSAMACVLHTVSAKLDVLSNLRTIQVGVNAYDGSESILACVESISKCRPEVRFTCIVGDPKGLEECKERVRSILPPKTAESCIFTNKDVLFRRFFEKTYVRSWTTRCPIMTRVDYQTAEE